MSPCLAESQLIQVLLDSVRPKQADSGLNVSRERRIEGETEKESEARWDRVYRAKFEDPNYYKGVEISSCSSIQACAELGEPGLRGRYRPRANKLTGESADFL
jgi:hypothetical protein